MTELTAENVHRITADCMFDDGTLAGMTPEEVEEWAKTNAILVDGLSRKFGFNPKKVELHKAEIAEMIEQVPDDFRKKSGGGMSFLNLCVRKDGVQWAEHRTMESLVVIAIAAGLGGYCAPRDIWKHMPGGMPYVFFE